MGAGNTESSAVVHINFVVDINSRMQRSIHNYYLYFFKYTCSMSKNIYNKKLWTVTKWHVVDCAQVFCKLLFFGGKKLWSLIQALVDWCRSKFVQHLSILFPISLHTHTQYQILLQSI